VSISPEIVERALAEIRRGRSNYEYFFERLSSPAWIAPLQEHGLLSGPPELEIHEGLIRAPLWPPSQYLARVAGDAPDDVLRAILEIETSNERVHEDFAEAALAFPPALAARWAQHEIQWLRASGHLYFLLPDKLCKLIVRLAEGDELTAALPLAEELFRPVPAEARSERTSRLENAVGRFDAWEYDRLLEEAMARLVDRVPRETLALLVELLGTALDLARTEGAEETEDYSYIWRTRIADDHRDERDASQALVSALRDAAVAVREHGFLDDAELVSAFVARPEPVFRRIALHALARPPAPKKEVLATALLSEDDFFAGEPSPEYRDLVAARFAELNANDGAVLLSWIERGPDIDSYRARRVEFDGAEPSDEEIAEYTAHWRIRRLALIREALPAKWHETYEELVKGFGESEFITSFEVRTWMGPTSPFTVDELSALSDDQIIDYLTEWEAPDRLGPEPSVEGLARCLSQLAENEPDRISRLASRLRNVRPPHVQWALIGLTAAARNEKHIEWPPVLELARWIVEQPSEIPGQSTDEIEEHGPGWTWARKEVASLIQDGLQSQTSAIPFSERQTVSDILSVLARDPDPTPKHEERYGGSNMDPATLSLNTTRGRTLHALVAYLLWVRRNLEADLDEESLTEHGFDLMPEARAILENHLDPTRDPSLAVRSVYGQRFPWLALVDRSWARAARDSIFPSSDAEYDRWAAAWGSYIIFCAPYNDIFEVLRPQYGLAIERLGSVRPEWRWIGGGGTPDERLGSHLLTYYWRGVLTLTDEDALLQRYFDSAPPEARRHAIEFVGRSLRESSKHEVPDALILRTVKLWEWRLAKLEALTQLEESDRAELAAFGWWADVDLLDLDWRLAQLERVLRLGGGLDPHFIVLDAVEKAVVTHPLVAMRILRLFLESEKGTWTIDAAAQQVEETLRLGLTAGDVAASELAAETVHWLGALGYRRFRKLLTTASAAEHP
jgi:hypothetical protein